MMSADNIRGQVFDFIVCGGGTAGLLLANRLAENKDFKILVLEAGSDNTADRLINTPGACVQVYGNPAYDWDFKTVPQKQLRDARPGWPRGKGLGGTSMINYMAWSHCSKRDLDNWRDLGNPGWGWSDCLPYMKKIETLHSPTDAGKLALAAEYMQPGLRGNNGPIQISFPDESDVMWLQKCWGEVGKNMGYPAVTDGRTGHSLGTLNQPCAINPETATRCYSANAFPKDRPNLTIITEALVTKILFMDDETSSQPRAHAVEVETKAGERLSFNAEREVLVCAGTVQSPQLLELSGIGSPALLGKHGIKVVVANEHVGENLQDHCLTGLAWRAKDGVPTAETIRDNPELVKAAMETYASQRKGPLAHLSSCSGFLNLRAVVPPEVQLPAIDVTETKLPPKQLKIQTQQLEDTTEGIYQIVGMPTGFALEERQSAQKTLMHTKPGNFIGVCLAISHPLSRGSIHITSNSVHDPPAIDPRYLSHPADLEMLAHGLLHADKIASTPPLKDYIQHDADGQKIVMPGLPPHRNLDEAREAVRDILNSEWHSVGTCSMLPREQGGVVDSELKVYGVRGLRVIDASIFPMHVQGNIMSLVYAVAENAADLIKYEYV